MIVEFLLFIKSQFTTTVQNILNLNQCTHGHVWSWNAILFQRSRGGCKWFNSIDSIKNELVKCLFIFIWSWIYWGF